MAEITVIVPAHNAASFIERTLQSVLTQDFPDLELIIVDDGSIDDTHQVLAAAASGDRRIVVVSQENQGVSKARNSGLRAASAATNAVMFLDHDDILLPGALTRLSQALYANSAVSAAHGTASVIDSSGNPASDVDSQALGLVRKRLVQGQGLMAAAKVGGVEMPDNEPTTFAALVYTSCITSPGQVLIRNSALKQAGGFDPGTAPSDDWDLYLRLSRIGPIAFFPEPVLGWRQHDKNASRDRLKMKRSSVAVRRKLLARSSKLSAAELAIVRTQFAYTTMALLASTGRHDGKTDFRTDLLPALGLFALSLVSFPAR
jgi:glycosyltransferase involved in cell wall biosynthesis